MSTWNRDSSYLGLLRALLASRGRGLPPSADTTQAATVPGQNQLEVYGMAIFVFVFLACWTVEAVGSIWLGIPLSFLFLHLSAVIGALIASRLPTLGGQTRWHQRLQWLLLGVLAWIAINEPFPLTRWLAWPLMLLILSELFLWPSVPTWSGVSVFVLAQLLAASLCLALPPDWRWGLPMIFFMHALMLYGSLHPQAEVWLSLTRHFPTNAKEVWLTIDDGPSADTNAILDLLERYDAKATFFVIGERAEAAPEAIRAMVERGHGVGNHTFHHPAATFWMYPGPWIRQEVERTQKILAEMTGRVPKLFRSPVGFKSPMLAPVLKEAGLSAIGWSARGYDGRPTEVTKALARICQRLQPGDIILLHQGLAQHVVLLEALLEKLKSEGFRCVVPNLFENETTRLS